MGEKSENDHVHIWEYSIVSTGPIWPIMAIIVAKPKVMRVY